MRAKSDAFFRDATLFSFVVVALNVLAQEHALIFYLLSLEENTFQRNERLLVPVLSSRRGLFARTSSLPTNNDDRFIVWGCAFLVFSR